VLYGLNECHRQEHEEIRAELVKATMEPGPIGEAANKEVVGLAYNLLNHEKIEEEEVCPRVVGQVSRANGTI
jgi:hypothetical protein